MKLRRIWAVGVMAGASAMAASGTAEAARWLVKNPTALAAHAGQVQRQFKLGQDTYVVVETGSDLEALPAVAVQAEQVSLAESLGAERVEPDYRIGVADGVLADDSQPNSDAPAWHVTRMRYADLPTSADGSGVVVAVLDTGVDQDHPALAPVMWTNADEIAGNAIDDDSNGYVDDVHGYSFARRSGDTTDQQSHGTHCSGIIAAQPQAPRADAARGVAPGVRIMAVHIIQGSDAATFLSDAAEGIKYAVDNGAAVLSNSWRVYRDWPHVPNDGVITILGEAIRYAEEHGAVFVVAAGNETKNIDQATPGIFPVGLEGHLLMVGVAASAAADERAGFSNFGPRFVHVAAPGDNIVSTTPRNGWQPMSGTSMATPLVAGVIARGISAGYDATTAVAKLQSTSDVLAPWSGVVTSGGIINIMSYLNN